MKNSQKGSATVVLLVIVIVILLGIIGYSYLKPKQSQVQVLDNISQTSNNQQNTNTPAQVTPKVSETPKSNNTAPVVNTTPELLTYSGKTDTGVSFSVKYPSSWTYYKFSCNADGVAFWPKTIAPNFSQGGACSMNSFLESSPIIVYSTGNQPSINLKNNNYQNIYNQMKSNLSY